MASCDVALLDTNALCLITAANNWLLFPLIFTALIQLHINVNMHALSMIFLSMHSQF